jgi:hypothetical protein
MNGSWIFLLESLSLVITNVRVYYDREPSNKKLKLHQGNKEKSKKEDDRRRLKRGRGSIRESSESSGVMISRQHSSSRKIRAREGQGNQQY